MHFFIYLINIILIFFFSLPYVASQSGVLSTDPQAAWLETEEINWEDEVDSTSYFTGLNKKIDLNTASRQQLDSVGVLSGIQLESFFKYRKTFGLILDIYELQAIPHWDIPTIRQLLTWYTIKPLEWFQQPLSKYSPLQSSLLLRWRLPNMNQTESSQPSLNWVGDKHSFQVLYRYNAPQLKAGLTLEKDPGENWLSSKKRLPADFISAHVAVSGQGVMRQLIIGDYNVNLAQGLIQWQAMNFRKTPFINLLKKSKPVFQVHRSVNEINFHRGIAVDLRHRFHSLSLFTSWRNLSANFGFSSLSEQTGVTSFNTSGYHRTLSEIAKQNNLAQFAFGGRYGIRKRTLNIGFNFIMYQFSAPLVVAGGSYDRFGIEGRKWTNASVDISFTRKNWHLFAEQAIDKKNAMSTITGLLLSVNKHVDMGFLVRLYSNSYQSFYANAIAEGSQPSNEKGLYWILNAKLGSSLQLQVFIDYFFFPWLRYSIDQPSNGLERFIQLFFQPSKKQFVYIRIREEQKMQTIPAYLSSTPLDAAAQQNRFQARFHLEQSLSSIFQWAFRIEATQTFTLSQKPMTKDRGALSYVQLRASSRKGKHSGLIRVLFFDTDSYQSRVYAFVPAGGGLFALGQYKNKGSELILSTENQIHKSFLTRINIQGVFGTEPTHANWQISAQIALKFHELAPLKIYRTF